MRKIRLQIDLNAVYCELPNTQKLALGEEDKSEMGIFDDFVDNTLDHLVDQVSDPKTYTGDDDDDDDRDRDDEDE
ncbi:MAG: hypothetical protein WCA10_10270 [Terracidiphilus sp.]